MGEDGVKRETLMVMRVLLLMLVFSAAWGDGNWVPLLPESSVAALAGELSGSSAKRNLEYLARLHRMRASRHSCNTRARASRAGVQTFHPSLVYSM